MQGAFSPPGVSGYTVFLQEPADAERSRCTWNNPQGSAYQSPSGLRRVVLNCTIHRHDHEQQEYTEQSLRLRLIFDRDVPLWQHEYPEMKFEPIARIDEHSQSPSTRNLA